MKIAVVDGYSTGRALVSALRDRGNACVHVQTSPQMPEYFMRGFRDDDYEVLLDGSVEPAALARRLTGLGVDRVVAGTESGVTLADVLSHLMGLPGNRYETLRARRDKQLMADVAAAAGVDVPHGAAFTSPDEAAAWFVSTRLAEAVVKPPSSAGSDNVRFCRTPDEVHSACKTVLAADNLYGQPNTVALVQERVHGVEYYANTVSHDGVHRVAELWRYTKRDGSAGHPIYDFEEPVPVNSAEAAPLRGFVSGVLAALGVVSGAAHTEVMMTGRGPCPHRERRPPGRRNRARCCGALVGNIADLPAGRHVDRPEAVGDFDDTGVTWSGALRNVALINSAAGRVRSLDWTERLKALHTLVHIAHGVGAGEFLAETTDLISSPGYVYLAAEDPQDIERDYRALRAMDEAGLYTG